MKRRPIVAALSAAAMMQFAVSASATPVAPGSEMSGPEVEAFARSLAAAASSAEASALPGDAARVEHAVSTTLQELVVTAAKPPANVRLALQRVVYICIRPAEVKRYTFNCPGTGAGLDGVRDVLTTVTALIEGSETAAIDGTGETALTDPPGLEAGAGSDYNQLR
jgi:hypothetical protein